MSKRRFKVTSKLASQRIDSLMAQKYGSSRNHWQQAIKSGQVVVNGRQIKPSYLLEEGDSVETEQAVEYQAKKLPPKLKIFYEDAYLMVIDKPSGLLVHGVTSHSNEPTVADFAAQHTLDTTPQNPGIVHRLDRETSGLLLLAKDTSTKNYLQKQFKERQIKKTYVALVKGHLKQSEALIDLPIGRKPQTAKRQVMPSGRTSQTNYRVLSEYKNYSLIEARPITGRTHQLRVHFSHLGHPIAGDKLYGKEPSQGLERLFLHACAIELTEPDGKILKLTSPLPPELKQFLDSLAAY